MMRRGNQWLQRWAYRVTRNGAQLEELAGELAIERGDLVAFIRGELEPEAGMLTRLLVAHNRRPLPVEAERKKSEPRNTQQEFLACLND